MICVLVECLNVRVCALPRHAHTHAHTHTHTHTPHTHRLRFKLINNRRNVILERHDMAEDSTRQGHLETTC